MVATALFNMCLASKIMRSAILPCLATRRAGTNTAIGDDALVTMTTGSSNVAVGDEAGSNLVDWRQGNIAYRRT